VEDEDRASTAVPLSSSSTSSSFSALDPLSAVQVSASSRCIATATSSRVALVSSSSSPFRMRCFFCRLACVRGGLAVCGGWHFRRLRWRLVSGGGGAGGAGGTKVSERVRRGTPGERASRRRMGKARDVKAECAHKKFSLSMCAQDESRDKQTVLVHLAFIPCIDVLR
jgi:hypothetical protein